MKIANKPIKSYLLIVLALTTFFGYASDPVKSQDGGIVDTEQEVKDYILHHLKDSHDFHLFSYTSDGERKHVGFPLPVIVWGENGLTTFMSPTHKASTLSSPPPLSDSIYNSQS